MVDTQWLKAQGIDPKSIHDYVAHGWLERVIRSVYRRPLPEGMRDTPENTWVLPLLSLQWIMKYDTYLGGESALDFAGYSHSLPLGGMPRVHFYGPVPPWLKRLPVQTNIVLHRCILFGDHPAGLIDASQGLQKTGHAVQVWQWPMRASSPERAILEALDELPGHASFDHLDKIFEGLTSLRPKPLMTQLTLCRSVKVRRLFFVFASRHRHPWYKHLDPSKIDFGSGPRALVKGGKLHPTYQIYVPQDLVPVDGKEMLTNA